MFAVEIKISTGMVSTSFFWVAKNTRGEVKKTTTIAKTFN